MNMKKKGALLLAAATIYTVAGAIDCIMEADNKRVVKKYKPRQYIMRPNDRKKLRERFGHQNLLAEMRLQDPNRFRNYLRMSAAMFDKLLNIVGPSITKSILGPTTPINPSTRLAITIRNLASGESQISLAHTYVLAKSTVSNIINETLNAIWENLRNLVLPMPTAETWLDNSQGFEVRWDYPNAIGAVDGKHIRIQQPPNSGSDYYNYKGYHSVILMAICDFRYRFVCIDVGAQGRQSDGGVFSNSAMGRRFAEDRMGVPPPAEISPYGDVLPFCLLGDEAFGLKNWLTTPYPGKSTGKLELSKEIFNYRLSRARRVIENAFGILVTRWRILKNALEVAIENVDNIVKAAICLHNYCLIEQENTLAHQQKYSYFCPQYVDHVINGIIVPGEWRQENSLDGIKCGFDRNPTAAAKKNRDTMAEFFMEEGQVDWQWNLV